MNTGINCIHMIEWSKKQSTAKKRQLQNVSKGVIYLHSDVILCIYHVYTQKTASKLAGDFVTQRIFHHKIIRNWVARKNLTKIGRKYVGQNRHCAWRSFKKTS